MDLRQCTTCGCGYVETNAESPYQHTCQDCRAISDWRIDACTGHPKAEYIDPVTLRKGE